MNKLLQRSKPKKPPLTYSNRINQRLTNLNHNLKETPYAKFSHDAGL